MEALISAQIKGWEGEPIHTLGRVLHSGHVEILDDDQQWSSRYFIAFPETIVIFEVEGPLEPLAYKGKLSMSGLVVRKMDPSEEHPFAFEISSNVIQPFTVVCRSVDSLNQWLQVFSNSTVRNLTTQLGNLTLPGSTRSLINSTLPGSIPVYVSGLQASSSSDSSLKDLPTRQKHETERSKPYCLSMTQEVLRQMEVNKRRNVLMPMSDSAPSSSRIRHHVRKYVEGAAGRVKTQIMRRHIVWRKSGVSSSLEGIENVTHTGENSNYTQNHQPHQSSEPIGLRPQSQPLEPSGMSNSTHDNLMTVGTIQEMPYPASSVLRSSRQELFQLMEESEQDSSEAKQKRLSVLMSNPPIMRDFIQQRRAIRQQQEIQRLHRQQQQLVIKLLEQQILRNSGETNIVDAVIAALGPSMVLPNPPESTQSAPESTQPAPESTQPAPESTASPTHTQTSLQMLDSSDSSQRRQQLVEIVKSQHIAPSHPDI